MSRIEKALEQAIQKQSEGQGQADKARLPQPSHEVSTVCPDHDPEGVSPYVVTVNQPGSPAAEQYRRLKSCVVKQLEQNPSRNSLMVTSAVGGEGKTLASLNLAITLSQEFDYTVLLVDADLRRPSVPGYLGLPPGPGLAEWILDGVDVGGALVRTGYGRLSILPAGKMVNRPAELLSSRRMKEAFNELRSRYADRVIIFDTTPLLPFADAHYISRMVDSILFVVRQGYTPLNKIRESIEMLEREKLLGFLCNEVNSSTGVKSCYDYYGY